MSGSDQTPRFCRVALGWPAHRRGRWNASGKGFDLCYRWNGEHSRRNRRIGRVGGHVWSDARGLRRRGRVGARARRQIW